MDAIEPRFSNDVSALAARFALPGAVAFRSSPLGGIVAELDFAGHRAEVALFGGQVIGWAPARQKPVLWLSEAARLDAGKAVRGGIPVCWPWFGPAAEPGRPSHGFVRTRVWSVRNVQAAKDGVALTLAAPLRPDDPVPSGLDLSLTVTLAHDLTVALTTVNGSSVPLTITEALHTYLAVGDIAAVTVRGLEGAQFLDQLSGQTRTETALLRIGGEIDRIYAHGDGGVTVEDVALGRAIRVDHSGSGSTVVWNPWIEKSVRLGDMAEGGYRRMLCVETANAGGCVVTLAPGDSHTLTAKLSVAAL